ncbi:MAG: ribonuclease D [Anaerolineaceae bacterium]|jgi:ribonuclease D
MQLSALPLARIINSPQKLHQMVEDLKKQPFIAVDTESNSLHAYQEQVCLIQISTIKTDYLIDTIALTDLDELGEIFADSAIQKVFHAGDYDIATLKRDFGFEIRNVFDTMLAATALAEPAIGLAALLEKYFDLKLEKKYQRANWGKRPLDPEMLAYAQNDSHYLLELRDILAKQLEEVGRLEAVLEDSAALAKVTLPMKDHEEDLWRVRGVQDLKPEALSLLREINHLREQIAMNRNVPPFKVFSDRLMIEVAQTQPHYLEELALLPSFSPAMMRRYGSQIMQTVEKWRRNPVPVKPRKITRLSDRELKLRDKLTNWRKAVGEKEGIPSNAVFPRDLLERIAHYDPTSMEALEEVMEDYPHRFQKYGTRIFNLIKRKEK